MQLYRSQRQFYRAYASASVPAIDNRQAPKGREKQRRKFRWIESSRRAIPDDGKSLNDFISDMPRPRRRRRNLLSAMSIGTAQLGAEDVGPSLGRGMSVFIETKGCQMNVSDTEVVRALLSDSGYVFSNSPDSADVVLINTCAIRDKAEEKVWQWLRMQRAAERKAGHGRRVFGVLGCMAERLKSDILERESLVDVVVGPDAYRQLPSIIAAVARGEPGAAGYNVQLSLEETYADIAPLRESSDKTSAFVSIMRGCENYCAFCVVPYTRGKERSRPIGTIVDEVRRLSDQGVKEVTLLGQNVNSWFIPAPPGTRGAPVLLAKGFGSAARSVPASARFPDLLHAVTNVDPEMRVRFTSPHPKHFPDDVLELMRETPNLCNYIHMPAQSGSNAVLERMRRRYTRESYLELVTRIRDRIPGVTLSTDMISGFCGETEIDHADTLALLREVEYDQGFFFHYSKRDKTEAARHMQDDVPEDVKLRRLREVIDTFHTLAKAKNERTELGSLHLVLVEEGHRRPPAHWDQEVQVRTGRTDGNKRVVFSDISMHANLNVDSGAALVFAQPGDYILVRVTSTTSLTLFCTPLVRTTLQEYSRLRTSVLTRFSSESGGARLGQVVRA